MKHIQDRFVREAERKLITQVSRTTAWKWEQQGLFPKRHKLNPSGTMVGWLLSELQEWVVSKTTNLEGIR